MKKAIANQLLPNARAVQHLMMTDHQRWLLDSRISRCQTYSVSKLQCMSGKIRASATSDNPLNICFLSPYHTGSHRAHISGYSKYTNHNLVVLSMTGQYWKQRMKLGGLSLSEQYVKYMQERRRTSGDSNFHFDIIIGTDMLDMSSFVAQSRRFINFDRTCLATYMHENQLTYPEPTDASQGVFRRNNGHRESQFIDINYKSQMASDVVLFNSKFHLENWFERLPKYLNSNRDEKLLHTVDYIRSKSQVLYVGVELSQHAKDTHRQGDSTKTKPNPVPLIIWNQRWEYDKDPLQFVRALQEISSSNSAKYRLAICGESFHRSQSTHQQFEKNINPIKDNIVHCGYADLEQYHSLLDEAVCTASTANHEFFGISMIENIYHNTFPVLPNRLSYPELIPQRMHEQFLYSNFNELVEKLSWALNHPNQALQQVQELGESMKVSRFDWQSGMAPHYDSFLSDMVVNHRQ